MRHRQHEDAIKQNPLWDKTIHYAEKCWAKANKKGNGGIRINDDEALKLASAFVDKIKDKQLLNEWLRCYEEGPYNSTSKVLNRELQLELKNRRKLDMSKRYQTRISNIYNAFVNGVERGGKIDSGCVIRVVSKITPNTYYKAKAAPSSYWSARIYLDGVLTYTLPYQDGNDSTIEYRCAKALKYLGVITRKDAYESLDECLKRHNPASYHTKRKQVARKFVIAWGRNNFWDKLFHRV